MKEGSRHEKAALTVTSYVIGFTAAYILFGNFSTTTPSVLVPTVQNQAASVIQTETAVEEVPVETTSAFEVDYRKGRLVVDVNGEETLLSVEPTLTDTEIDTDAMTQGYHYGAINYTTDSENSFVFFCENHGDEYCNGFVYDINADRIYPVTKSGKAVQISQKSAEEAIFTAVGLKIGSNYSANKSAPWILISGD